MNSFTISSVTLTAIGALVLPILAVSAQPQEGRRRPAQGLCRNAPQLPPLPVEARYDPGQYSGNRRGGDYPMPPPPPVAMSAPVADSAKGSGEVVVTASRREEAEASVSAPPPPPAPVSRGYGGSDARESARTRPPSRPWPQPQPRAGLLTAGEHDDLLNPELYAQYVRASDLAQKIRDLPRVDTERVLTVSVRDAAGQPMPFARVTLTCSDGNTLSLATQADGRVVFFPGLDRLGRSVSIGTPGAPGRTVTISNAPGGQDVGITLRQSASAVRKFDLALVIDTTGSMGDEIRYLQTELRSILDRLKRAHPQIDMRVGFVFYRDEGDSYVTNTHALTNDLGRSQSILAQQSAEGGGDYPEAMDLALGRAVGLGWRPDAVKSMLLVADAPPHDDKFGKAWAATEAARAKRIHIVPVAASGVADDAEYAMRAMAAATQSRYLFLTDDSGVGNPHAPPAIDCYLVTRLDSAVRRVLDSQLSGRRIEPERQEVIRSVGQYDGGRCVLPRDWRAQS